MDHVPDHLVELCLQAPYQAARNAVDVALREEVDFVILSGDIVNPRHGGPRAVSFLMEQLRRLQAKQIEVYWCGGAGDHFASWPSAVPLPANVHIFPADRVASWVHKRGEEVIATIQGRSSSRRETIRATDFSGDSSRFTIAVAYGQWDTRAVAPSGVDYWALGGSSTPSLVANPDSVGHGPRVQFAGSCQGRSSTEAGEHGVYVVEVEGQQCVRCDMFPTDAVRWHAERMELPDDMTSSGLQRVLRDRTQRLRDAHPDRWVFTRWTLFDGDQSTDTRSDQLAANLRQGGLAAELTRQLRSEFGTASPGVWTVSIKAETPTHFPAGWYEEDTVLGDLLRSVQQYQKHPERPVQLDEFEANHELPAELIEALKITSATDRETVLREVAALGVDLLRGDRVLSEELATLVGWAESEAAR
jgi:DNA repair exonuclease SbcCD nuclease subunit